MSSITLRFTQFKVQRLQCIGGHGRIAPYRITTYHSTEIGSFGQVMETAAEASNASEFDNPKITGLKRLLNLFNN